MIYKLFITTLIVVISLTTAFSQKKSKPDLYLYFKTDSLKRIYKTNEKSEPIIRNKKIRSLGYDRDIYHYSYISANGETEYIYMLFYSIDKNNFCVSDTSLFKKHIILPYKNLEKIKGLISDEWTDKNFAYQKVFLVEKIAENQFKTIQVKLNFPFNSNGYRSRPVNSNEIFVHP